ncbi:Neuroblastoma breakpoint family member 4 [Plecturocebus cupreus]
MEILEINQELRFQLAESQQQFADLKEKFLVSQATAYSLAKQLKKYQCEENKDIIDSMLRDEVQFVEKLAEKLRQAAELRQYKALVHSQAKELTQLREKLREGRDASHSLNQHFKAILTPDDPDKSQENDEDEDEDVTDEETENIQESPAPREVQKAEEKEVPQDSLEECAATCSNSYGPSDSNQPHRSTKVTFEGEKVDSAPVVDSECSQDEGEEALNILPGNQNDHKEEEGKVPVPPRTSRAQWFWSSPVFIPCLLYSRLSQELPEVKEHEGPEDSLDEMYLTPSVHQDLSDCHQPHRSTLSSLYDQLTCSALYVASPTQESCPQGTCSGDLSYYLSEVQASQIQLEPSTLIPNSLGLQLDEGVDCGNGLASRGLSSTTCSFTANADSGTQWLSQELVLEPSVGMKNPLQLEDDALEGSADNTQGRQVTGRIHASSVLKPKAIKRKLQFSKWIPRPSCLGCREFILCLPYSRLSQELPEVKEQEGPEDFLDEMYLTPSVQRDLSDCHQPYSSTLSSLDDQLTCSALDVACEYSSLQGKQRRVFWVCFTKGKLRLFLLKPLLLSTPTQVACPQGSCSGDLSYYLSEVQASQTQLEPSTLMTNCLQLQLDQGFDIGNGLARQGLSSTTCSFTANADSGTQCPFQGREGKGNKKV